MDSNVLHNSLSGLKEIDFYIQRQMEVFYKVDRTEFRSIFRRE